MLLNYQIEPTISNTRKSKDNNRRHNALYEYWDDLIALHEARNNTATKKNPPINVAIALKLATVLAL